MPRKHERIVGPESVRMLELGHPWIIADGYTKKWPAGRAGDLVELTDGSGKFLASALLEPGERIIARILSRGRMDLDRTWLKERLDAAVSLRREHAGLRETNAFRLVNGEGDGLPGLVVDRYDEYLMIQLYSGGWRPHLPVVTGVLQELLQPQGIYEKSRPRNTRELEATADTKKYGRRLAGRAASERLAVRENGLKFLVDLERGLNTGLFLDQRVNRSDLMPRVKGKRVLNLFAYTGAFSVTAAAGGAELVTTVDVSPAYMEWAKANFELNRLKTGHHEFVIGDCREVLSDLTRREKPYDIVLMDPPSFSTTARGRFTTRGGTSDLVAAALPLLRPGGLFIASSNHQKVDVADYLKELRRGALQAACELQVVTLAGQPADFPYPVTFPEGRYLKYAVCVKGQNR